MERTPEIEAKSAFLTPLHLALLSFLIAVPVFSGFDLASSTRFGIFLSINIISGQYLWSKLLIKRNPSIFESLAAGLVLGTSIPAVINIGIRFLDQFGFSTGFIFPSSCVLGWLIFDRKIPQLSASTNERDDQDFRILLVTPLLAIVAWNPHAWPFCAAYIFGTIFVWRINSNSKCRQWKLPRKITTAAIFVFALVLHRIYISQFLEKPIWRLSLGTDASIDEGAAWSISTLGSGANAFFYGHPLRGHFITNIWAGDLASTANLPAFFLTANSGFAVGILGISIVIYVSSIFFLGKRLFGLISSIVLITQASLPEELMVVAAPRYANSISTFYFVFGLLFVTYLFGNGLKQRYLFWGFLIFVVTLSKTHWGLLLVGSTCFIASLVLMRRRQTKLALISMVSIVSFFSTYFIFINGILYTEKIVFSFSLQYLILILLSLGMRGFGVFTFSRREFHKLIPGSLTFTIAMMTIVAMWITNGENNTFYFMSATLAIAAMYRFPSIFGQIETSVNKAQSVSFVFLGAFFGIFTSLMYVFLRYRITGSIQYKLIYWLFIENVFLLQPLLVLFLALILVICSNCRKFTSKLHFAPVSIFMLCSLLAIGFNLGNWIVQPLKPTISNFWQDIDFNSDIVFSPEQIEVAKWLNENTLDESIIATNFACPSAILSDPQISDDLECLTRNTLSWIVPLARRQALIENSWYLMNPGTPIGTEIKETLDDIEGASFSNRTASFKKLRNRGVDYLVVDIDRSALTGWLPHAVTVFSNTQYFVAKLQ